MTRLVTPGAGLAVAVALWATPACSASAPRGRPPTGADATVRSCATDLLADVPDATVTVRNHSAVARSYRLRVDFVDLNKTVLTSGEGRTDDVAPGGTAAIDVRGGTVKDTRFVVDCKISTTTP